MKSKMVKQKDELKKNSRSTDQIIV